MPHQHSHHDWLAPPREDADGHVVRGQEEIIIVIVVFIPCLHEMLSAGFLISRNMTMPPPPSPGTGFPKSVFDLDSRHVIALSGFRAWNPNQLHYTSPPSLGQDARLELFVCVPNFRDFVIFDFRVHDLLVETHQFVSTLPICAAKKCCIALRSNWPTSKV